jgi:hypothetical protein
VPGLEKNVYIFRGHEIIHYSVHFSLAQAHDDLICYTRQLGSSMALVSLWKLRLYYANIVSVSTKTQEP